MTRGQRGRQIGRAMMTFAVVVGIGIPVFLFLATPSFGPMMGPRPLLSDALPVLAAVGIVVGLVWMVRIYRADPEPDQHAWRYRSKR